MKRERLIAAAAVCAGIFLWPSHGASAQGAPTNESCLECHSDAGMAQTPASLVPIKGTATDREKLTLQVTADSLKGSVHEGFACTDCHGGIKDLPHDEKLPPPSCGSCHEDAAKELAAGVHRAEGKNAQFVPRCWDCHGAHRILPASNPESPVNHRQVMATCGACHGNRELMERAGVRITDPYKSYLKSQHFKILQEGNGKTAAVCGDCHGNHKILGAMDPASPIFKTNIPATCGKCHGDIREKYAQSIHGTALAAGNIEAPSCADCHGEHDIEAPSSPTSAVYAGTIGKTTCPQCHASVRLARRFDLPEGMVKSYQASFHGLASKFGETNVANCASCHGAHDILPSSDPRSSIAPANLTATCGKCHPNAGANFARTPIHLQVSISDSPVLYWIRKLYLWIIAGTLLALGLHNLLDFIRRYRDAIRALKPKAIYIRMTLQERIQHWLLLSTFFILVITGFALKYPDSVWALPFQALPGGFEMRGWLHRAAAVVMILDAVYHLAYLATTDRGRRFVKDVLPTWQDVKDVVYQAGYYLGLRPQAAQFGRFSYAEKVEYLALIWGTLVMVGTGFVLWFKTTFTRFLPAWGYTASEMIHFYEAVLAFSTIIIWHLYAVFSHTEKPPYNPTWLTGRMTERDLEHYHYRVVVELERERRLRAAKAEKEGAEAPAGGREEDSTPEKV